MAKAMLPYAVKKRTELKVVLDYFSGRITSLEFVEVMNEEVRQGQRTGKIRAVGPELRRRRPRKKALER